MTHREARPRQLFGFINALALALSAWGCAAPPTAVEPEPFTAADRLESFDVPSNRSRPRHVALGSDGSMWFTESRSNDAKIGRIDARGRITEFRVPNPSSRPGDIVLGADGALWFTGVSGFPDFFIGRVTTEGRFTDFAPGCDPQGRCSIEPQGIARGPDGNIWFTETSRNTIARLTPSGTFTFFTIPTGGAQPSGITAGPDGALWFAEFGSKQIGRLDPATGATTEFGPLNGSPERITVGPDGNLWFTQPLPYQSGIGRITPEGVIREFPLPNGAQPRDIVAGADGNLYFTEYGGGRLTRITTSGLMTKMQDVRGGWGIGRGAGRTLWLTQIEENRVARFELP